MGYINLSNFPRRRKLTSKYTDEIRMADPVIGPLYPAVTAFGTCVEVPADWKDGQGVEVELIIRKVSTPNPTNTEET